MVIKLLIKKWWVCLLYISKRKKQRYKIIYIAKKVITYNIAISAIIYICLSKYLLEEFWLKITLLWIFLVDIISFYV